MKASAPGKLAILGEHAVVYGYPCIAMSINKRIYAIASTTVTPGVTVGFVEGCTAFFKKKYNIGESVKVKTESEIDPKYGLGSSSAVTVAAVRALCKVFRIKLSKKELFDLCYSIHRDIQGGGSGFDIAVSIYEGIIYYKKQGPVIERIGSNKLPLIVCFSGRKVKTKKMIDKVAERYKRCKKETGKIFKKITELVEAGRQDIENGDLVSLGERMNQNHKLLQDLSVSTEKLDLLVKSAVSAGAYGAKLSGAGGGDCIIALVSDKKREIIERALKNAGGKVLEAI